MILFSNKNVIIVLNITYTKLYTIMWGINSLIEVGVAVEILKNEKMKTGLLNSSVTDIMLKFNII